MSQSTHTVQGSTQITCNQQVNFSICYPASGNAYGEVPKVKILAHCFFNSILGSGNFIANSILFSNGASKSSSIASIGSDKDLEESVAYGLMSQIKSGTANVSIDLYNKNVFILDPKLNIELLKTYLSA